MRAQARMSRSCGKTLDVKTYEKKDVRKDISQNEK